MQTLTFHGTSINSLQDIYHMVLEELELDAHSFGYNLDALYDVLSDRDIAQILITDNHLLKEKLSKTHKNDRSEYELFLDLLTDLRGIKLQIQ